MSKLDGTRHRGSGFFFFTLVNLSNLANRGIFKDIYIYIYTFKKIFFWIS